MLKRVEEYRANKVLFNFLVSNNVRGVALLPANICPDVVETVKATGMEVLFADISTDSYCLDVDSALSLCKDVQLVLFVHTYGIEDSFDCVFRKLKGRNPKLIIVDDRCLCMPHTIEFCDADLVLFSTGEKKIVDLKEGGIGYYQDKWDYDDMCDKTGFLMNRQFCYNQSEFEKKKKVVLEHRNRINAIYRDRIPQEIQLPSQYQQWRFNILVENKEEVLSALFLNGLYASGHYQPLTDGCPNAEWLFDHVINLFEDHYYTEEQALKTCEIINRTWR